ncbi:histone deacetylase [Amycolatopsis suaedae]|nr:histone deacetylase [Amycolatopsis suaedae]
MDDAARQPEWVWYVSYGSNMARRRFDCYLSGGTPPGAQRIYPGCRNRTAPTRIRPCSIPGGVYFATYSPVWNGGRAFLDVALPETTPATAYLITAGQFADVAAQEMYRDPGADVDLRAVLTNGRDQLGPGRYETLQYLGNVDGYPLLTFTAPWSAADVEPVPPSAAYLRMLAIGLRDTHGWTVADTAEHLAHRPGARGNWTAGSIAAAISS